MAVLKVLLAAQSSRGRELRQRTAAAALLDLLPGAAPKASSAAADSDPQVTMTKAGPSALPRRSVKGDPPSIRACRHLSTVTLA